MPHGKAGSGSRDRVPLAFAKEGVRELSRIRAEVVVGDDHDVVAGGLAGRDLLGEEAPLVSGMA